MKKILVIVQLIAVFLAMTSCGDKESRPTGLEFPQDHCINAYIIDPTFEANYGKYNYTDTTVISIDLIKPCKSIGVRDSGYTAYSQRYHDEYMGKIMVGPPRWALAEPLKLRCYEVTVLGEKTDVSDKIKFRAGSFYPFIKSGYNDAVCSSDVQYPGRLVFKPLTELTEEDMTLVIFPQPYFLFAIPPYEISLSKQYVVVIESGGKTQIIEVQKRNTK